MSKRRGGQGARGPLEGASSDGVLAFRRVTLAFEAHVRDALASGQLVRVLERFCEPFPGYYLYDPQRRHASRAPRALIDHLRRWRQAGRSGKRGR